MAIANWVADFADPINFLEVFSDASNDAQYHDDTYNSLIEAINQEADPHKRLKIMHEAEKKLFNDCVIIPFFFISQPIVINPGFKGYFFSPMGVIDLTQAYREDQP